ncbi:metallophosphoesterase [Cephaloticoccus primus]|uniref:Metallophosphoesterase n=1 Tax=Cephaloticoccus primus TaxID=1548207 RepID=A0A139SMJ2_9BACT|nr:metallophosphoesterase [Cephaloticoccus primus]KXU35808.1 metallophosphoesterase [Cephaloticoccus primus]
MRLAVLGDIHGNLPALEAVLKEIERLSPDQLLVSGDVVDGGPDSALCWERVKSLGCPIIRGNHERYVFDYGTPQADPVFATEQFAPLHYTVENLSAAQRAELAALPLMWASADWPGLLVVHASQRSDADSIWPHTPSEMIDPMFSKPAPKLIVRSHNHFCSTRQWRGRRIVTTGSVGLPLDGQPRAQFCVLTKGSARTHAVRVEHRSVAYDVGATLRRCQETGYAARAGVLGRMFMREIATGAPQVVPFLRHFHSRLKETPALTLTQAEEEYRRL